MIDVQNLSKYFGERAAVRDVSFTVEKGEVMGFLGPNGAGKSTTMKMITGLMAPSRGTARVAGFDIAADSLEARRRIGYMPENVPLYKDMLVGDFLHFVAALRDVPRGQRRRRVDTVMEQCGLGHVARRLIGNLSKGYQQRVGLAQALVSDPPVLILDEPTSGLDPQQIVEIRALVQSFTGAKTVILSTHILPEVSMTCSKVAIISQGRVVAAGPLDQIAGELAGGTELLVTVRGEADLVRRVLESVGGIREARLLAEARGGGGKDGELRFALVPAAGAPDMRADVAAGLAQAGVALLELRQSHPSLEDVYLRAVSGWREAGAVSGVKGRAAS